MTISYRLNHLYDFDYKKFFHYSDPVEIFRREQIGKVPGFLAVLRRLGIGFVRKSFAEIGLHDAENFSAYYFSSFLFFFQRLSVLARWFGGVASFYDVLRLRQLYEVQQLKKLVTSSRIVFSARPWDIATMSMRGINSCMSWDKKQSFSLVGSILDPNCAIIYLQNDSIRTFYGSKMRARAIVRRVQDKDRKQFIYLERVYLSKDDFLDEQRDLAKKLIRNVFANYLADKSRIKILLNYREGDMIEIPSTSDTSYLPEEYESYRDSGIPYGP